MSAYSVQVEWVVRTWHDVDAESGDGVREAVNEGMDKGTIALNADALDDPDTQREGGRIVAVEYL